jgi:hypothetical protein
MRLLLELVHPSPSAVVIIPVVLASKDKAPMPYCQSCSVYPRHLYPRLYCPDLSVFAFKATKPTAVLLDPVVFAAKEPEPTAVLLAPVVFTSKAFLPKAVVIRCCGISS